MVKLAEEDPRIVAVTAAMPDGTGLQAFAKKYPGRFFDVGIAEQHGVTFAAGMAVEGLIPVVAIYSTFLQRAYDQIVHDVCLEAHHVVFVLGRGGIVGEDGPTHNGVFDFSYLRSLPNMVVMTPKDENEMRRMLLTAISHHGPIALRLPKGSGEGAEIEEKISPVPIGKGEVLREGEDVLVLAVGRTVGECLSACESLEKEGIRATVVNCRFVKPLDKALLLSLVQRIPRIVTVEENVLQGGFGSAILECLSDGAVRPFSLKRIGLPDAFVEHGSQSLLRSKYGIDAAGIVKGVRDLLIAPDRTAKKAANVDSSAT